MRQNALSVAPHRTAPHRTGHRHPAPRTAQQFPQHLAFRRHADRPVATGVLRRTGMPAAAPSCVRTIRCDTWRCSLSGVTTSLASIPATCRAPTCSAQANRVGARAVPRRGSHEQPQQCAGCGTERKTTPSVLFTDSITASSSCSYLIAVEIAAGRHEPRGHRPLHVRWHLSDAVRAKLQGYVAALVL